MGNKTKVNHSELVGFAFGLWVGTIGDSVFTGEMFRSFFKHDVIDGLYIWMLIMTAFLFYALSRK